MGRGFLGGARVGALLPTELPPAPVWWPPAPPTGLLAPPSASAIRQRPLSPRRGAGVPAGKQPPPQHSHKERLEEVLLGRPPWPVPASWWRRGPACQRGGGRGRRPLSQSCLPCTGLCLCPPYLASTDAEGADSEFPCHGQLEAPAQQLWKGQQSLEVFVWSRKGPAPCPVARLSIGGGGGRNVTTISAPAWRQEHG